MNIDFLADYYIVPIVVLCLCIGYVMKHWMPTDNRIIPTVVFLVGMVCGVIINGLSVDSLAMGAFSGLVSTGLHQLISQYTKKYFGADIDDDVFVYDEDEEVDEDEE